MTQEELEAITILQKSLEQTLKPAKYEYKRHEKRAPVTQKVDTLEYLNELGQEGWQALSVGESFVPNAGGLSDSAGTVINDVVIFVLAKRQVRG